MISAGELFIRKQAADLATLRDVGQSMFASGTGAVRQQGAAAGDFHQSINQGLRQSPSGVAHTPGLAGANPTMRSTVSGFLTGALGPFALFAQPLTNWLAEKVPDVSVGAGRRTNPTMIKEEQARLQAMQDIGQTELRKSLASDLGRLAGSFFGDPNKGQEIANYVNKQAPPGLIQFAAQFVPTLSSALPGYFNNVVNAADFARLGRVLNNGNKAGPEHIQQAYTMYEEFYGQGVFPESIVEGGDRNGALQAMVIAAETSPGGEGFNAERVGRIAHIIDNMYQSSGGVMPISAASNLVRHLGPRYLDQDPELANRIGAEIGKNIAAGYFTPEEATAAIDMGGLIGLRAMSMASEMQSSTYRRGGDDAAASSVAYIVERLSNSDEILYLDAVLAHGNEQQREVAQAALDDFSMAEDPKARDESWQRLSNLRRGLGKLDRSGRFNRNIDTALTYGVSAGAGSGNNGSRTPFNSAIETMSEGALQHTMFQQAAKSAQRDGAKLLSQAFKGDQRALSALSDYVTTGVDESGMLDRGTIAALSRNRDPRLMHALQYRLQVEARKRSAPQTSEQPEPGPEVEVKPEPTEPTEGVVPPADERPGWARQQVGMPDPSEKPTAARPKLKRKLVPELVPELGPKPIGAPELDLPNNQQTMTA